MRSVPMQELYKWNEGAVRESSSVPRYSHWYWDHPVTHLIVSYIVWSKNILRSFTTNR
jgi:hypothetical protein